MVSELGVDNSPRPSLRTYSFLNYLTCFQCHHDLKNPITLSCGHSVCLSCLPTNHEKDTCESIQAQKRANLSCPFLRCSSKYTCSEFKVDVTLSKILQICRREFSQPRAENHLDNISLSSNTQLLTFVKNIQPEFECQICYLILYDPTTTPCGHTFCKECLLRTMDHSNQCPTCRSLLSFSKIRDQQTNSIISRLTEIFFSEIIFERAHQLSQKLASQETIPILVGNLIFPHISYSLHIFEPPYRLLIRRCLETKQRQFGIVTRSNSKSLPEYGTLVHIKSSQSFPDGRYLIQVEGLQRFRISEFTNQDGYHTAKIELIEDDKLFTEKEMDDVSMEEMVLTIRAFINSLGKGYPQLVTRLNQLYGPPPQALIPFSYWASCVIPIDDQEKYKLLCVKSTRLRLLMIVHWFETARKQWGFVNCSVM